MNCVLTLSSHLITLQTYIRYIKLNNALRSSLIKETKYAFNLIIEINNIDNLIFLFSCDDGAKIERTTLYLVRVYHKDDYWICI